MFSKISMNHTRILVVALLAVLATVSFATYGISPASAKHQALSDSAIILLSAQPLSSYTGNLPGYAATMPVPGGKLDLTSPAAVAYSSFLASQRNFAKMYLARFAPEVTVTYEYSTVLNGLAVNLNGADIRELNHLPGVVTADYTFSVHTDMNRSPTLIGAPTLWAADGGQANAGAGIRIGIIDTGIDFTHPFLTDNSLVVPAGFPKCDALDSAVHQTNVSCKYVSNTVIVAKMFCTQAVCAVFDAQAKQDHGSHVSGIAAGVANTCAPFVGCTLSGIAPKAFLGSYNVFPGNVLGASSHDISKAVEAAVADGMDVLNLSLGGTANPDDVLVNAVNAATDAGVVVAIAAGNAGPGAGTIESHGIADKVITVGASTNPHFIGIPTTVTGIGTFGAAVGEFASYVPAVTAYYVLTTPSNGCSAISQNLSNSIALIRRGTCTFTTKVRNAQNAGAIGVIVINSQQGDPIAMAQDGTTPVPTIPAVMVSITNGNAMAAIAPSFVTVDGTMPQEFFSDGAGADILASFSSVGPPLLQSPGAGIGQPQDKIKPDVVAPGVNVYSSVPNFACASPPCFAFFQGTSMATPHVAGSAALLRQLHPTWSPEQVKSALVNSAHRPVKSFTSGNPLLNPMVRGAGRIDLAAASQVSATLETSPTPSTTGNGQASFSFGDLQASSQTRSFTITLTSVSTSTVTYTISVMPAVAGPTVTTSATSITLTAGGTATVDISLTLSPSLSGAFYGDVQLTGGPVALNVPYWVFVDPPVAGSGHIFKT